MNTSCLHCTLQRDLTGNSESNYTNTIPEISFTRYCYRYPVLETLKSPQKVFPSPYHYTAFLNTYTDSCCSLIPLPLVLPACNKHKVMIILFLFAVDFFVPRDCYLQLRLLFFSLTNSFFFFSYHFCTQACKLSDHSCCSPINAQQLAHVSK